MITNMLTSTLKRKLAKDDVHAKVFDKAARSSEGEVIELLLAHPKTPPHALYVLAHRTGYRGSSVLNERYGKFLAHPNLDTKALREVFVNSLPTAAKISEFILKKHPELAETIPAEAAKLLVRTSYLHTHRELGQMVQIKELPESVYDELWALMPLVAKANGHMGVVSVSKEFAAQPGISTNILTELLMSDHKELRDIAARHPKATPQLLDLLPFEERERAHKAATIRTGVSQLRINEAESRPRISESANKSALSSADEAEVVERKACYAETQKRLMSAQTLAQTMVTHLDFPLPEDLKLDLQTAASSTVKMVTFYAELLDAPCTPQASRAITVAKGRVDKAITSYENVVESLINLTEASDGEAVALEGKFEQLRVSTNAWVSLKTEATA